MWTRLLLVASLAAVTACGPAAPYVPLRTPEAPARVPSDIAHTESSFAGKGGVKLFAQSWAAKGDKAPRGALVVVHGLKDHSSRYADFAEGAARDGWVVHAFDLRGHGRSAGARVYVDSFDDYLDDLDAFVRDVKRAHPGVPVFLFGHSMGGAIVTLDVIARHPDVRGVVLSGAALRADVSDATRVGTHLLGAVAPRAPVFQLDLDQFSRDPSTVWWGHVDPLVYQEPGPARTAEELLDAIDRIDGAMEQVTVPLFVMHGGADVVTPPDGSRELYRRAHAQDKTLRIYDGLFHDLLHEPERDQVARDVLEWLDRHV